MRIALDLPDPEATRALGLRLGPRLFPGAVIALVGPLGAGKTHLVRALAEGLQVRDPRLVSSPTYVLLQEYSARLPLYHFDAYRLAGPAAFAELGVEELLNGEGVCLVEWADRVEDVLPPRLRIVLEVTGERTRRANLEATDPRYFALLSDLSGTPLAPGNDAAG